MKTIGILIIMIFIVGCSKEIEVTSIDQIPGIWKWEYTCGGILNNCEYSSKAHFAKIEFSSDGRYIEKHNDTIYIQTNYSIVNIDYTFGTLILENPALSVPITILNNRLLITRGELLDNYRKIK
jgi:hypothetical protein